MFLESVKIAPTGGKPPKVTLARVTPITRKRGKYNGKETEEK